MWGTYREHMPLEGEYDASPDSWVREQVALYEQTGGREGNTLRGMPVAIYTIRKRRNGHLRKVPLMRVEHDGKYLLVASKGGAPKNPVWYYSLKEHPEVEVQDGPEPFDAVTRQLHGPERAEWWERAVAAYPDYAKYQKNTDREIPIFLAERVSHG
jgi:deazaflavin-dependent oxidoreductase (nitroreductase family)